MENEDKKIKIEFVPGCFDAFEGSQEELDELVAEITRLAESGELLQNSTGISDQLLSEMDDDLSDEEFASLVDKMFNDAGKNRRLN